MKKWYSILKTHGVLILFILTVISSPVRAQKILFDFDNLAAYTPFPVDDSISGIKAHLSGTGQGYSIQNANVLGFTPAEFSGNCIYPSSIYLADLLISFDQKITDFSIMCSPQELACDNSATLRVTAYMDANLVGTNTTVAYTPGTWPTDTLTFSSSSGFNNVVVHYDSPPPTCTDYGVIFLADNMRVTPLSTGLTYPETNIEKLILPNPVSQSATILFSLLRPEHISITVYDITGRVVTNLFNGSLPEGEHQINWNVNGIENGMYIISFTETHLTRSYKLVVAK